MPANHGLTHDASMYPALKSLALETLFDQMKNGKTDSDRRIAAIAALRYLTIVEDPRRKAPAPAVPNSPPPAPSNSPPTQPPPSACPRPPTPPAMAQASSHAFSSPRAAAQAPAQPAVQKSEPPAAASPPRLVHPRAKRNPHVAPLLPGGNPPFVSTFAPAFLTNPKLPVHRAGASP